MTSSESTEINQQAGSERCRAMRFWLSEPLRSAATRTAADKTAKEDRKGKDISRAAIANHLAKAKPRNFQHQTKH